MYSQSEKSSISKSLITYRVIYWTHKKNHHSLENDGIAFVKTLKDYLLFTYRIDRT